MPTIMNRDYENVDDIYAGLIEQILECGEVLETRNATVKRLCLPRVAFDTTPLVSVRKTAWKNAIREWEWFLSGSSNIRDLHPNVRSWWKPWADSDGSVQNNYSDQFRTAMGAVCNEERNDLELVSVDQIEAFVEGIRDHPYSRRNLITTWNAAEMWHPSTPITNCHSTVIQAFVDGKDQLSLFTYQRSADVICGLPHNWIQMAAFQLWLTARTGKTLGRLVWEGGDVHIYTQHLDIAKEIVKRVGECKSTPCLSYVPSSKDFLADDFDLEGEYKPVITTKAEMVV